MPTYEYQCDKCGGEFDFFQSIKEAPKETCEKCGGHLTKLLSAGTGLIFKGSGFYITDYKGGSGKIEGSSSGDGGSSSDSKSSGDKAGAGTSDSKSASGSESKSSATESKPAASAPAKSKD